MITSSASRYEKDRMLLLVICGLFLFGVCWFTFAMVEALNPLFHSSFITIVFKMLMTIMSVGVSALVILVCLGFTQDVIIPFLQKYYPNSILLKKIF
jgi:hypothetical protein